MSEPARNIRLFYAFRVLFNARMYYPVFAILFLDFGLTIEQFAVLNTAWAVTIVLLEVPSGAMADTLGRVALLRLAAVLMVVELLLIVCAPIGMPAVVFWMFLLNRIVSGTAEAMASGADEAMAYDSLVETPDGPSRETQWSGVLAHVMRYQSMGFIVAMVLGGVLYDREFMNGTVGAWIGQELSAGLVTRLPVLATLLMGIAACVVTAFMCDPGTHCTREDALEPPSARAAWKAMRAAGRRVLTHPVILLVIIAGVLHDSVIRLLLTLGSEYYRMILVPEKYFGLLGAAMAALGLFVPALGQRLVNRLPAPAVFAIVSVLTIVAFTGAALAIPLWGVSFMVIMMAGFSLLNYIVSFYLNREATSNERATLLSFRGLAYNLGYGVLGLVYAAACRGLAQSTDAASPDDVFAHAMWGFPLWFGGSMVVLVVIALAVWQRRPRDIA